MAATTLKIPMSENQNDTSTAVARPHQESYCDISFPQHFLEEMSLAESKNDVLSVLAHWLPRFIASSDASLHLMGQGETLEAFSLNNGTATPLPALQSIECTTAADCYLSQTPKIIADTTQAGTSGSDAFAAEIKCVMYVPLLFGGKCIGTLNVAHTTPNFYSHQHMAKLQNLALWLASHVSLYQKMEVLFQRKSKFKQLAAIAERSNDLILISDKKRRVVWVNQSFERITGYRLEEIIGQRSMDLVRGPKTDPDALQYIADEIAEGRTVRRELLIYDRDKREHWIEVDIQPVLDQHGNVEMFISTNREITGKKLADRQLREQEAEARKLALVAEHIVDMIIITDKERRIQWVNRAFEQKTDCNLADVKGMATRDLFLSLGTEPAVIQKISADLRADRAARYEFSISSRSGRHYQIEADVKAISDDRGEIEMYIASCRDVSASKTAEEKLRKSEAQAKRLAMVAERAGDMVLILNQDRRIEWTNPSFTRTFGYSLEEAIGKRPEDFLHGPATNQETLARVQQRVCGRKSVRAEIINYSKSGREIWVEFDQQLVFDDAENVEKIISIHRDITDIKQREAELIEARDRANLAKSVLDQLSSPVVVKDRHLNCIMVNEAWRQLHGVTGTQVLGRETNEFFPSKLANSIRESDLYVLHTGETFEFDRHLKDPSGKPLQLIANKNRITTEDGNNYIVAVIYDVTELKENEAKLQAAQEEAEHSNRLKSEFLANMSHEIRTPLNGVLGMTQLLQRTELNERQRKFASTILTSSNSLLSVINDVLDISRIEAGLMELHDECFDAAEVVEQACDTVLGIAVAKGLHINREINLQGPKEFIGDKKRIRQVLINLAGNAVKFTDQGRVLITVDDSPAIGLKFSVRDSGPGIPENQQKAIFERFRQADGSNTRKHGGTGLGLAISKNLVDLMNGEIGVESQLGDGATFWFTVPIPTNAQALDTSIGDLKTIEKTMEDPTAEANIRLLLVEDNAINQAVVVEGLKLAGGFEVEVAHNGADAIERLGKAPFDIVLMDIQMPVMTGDEAIQLIRSSGAAYRSVPIIALTANAMDGARERFLDFGADAYLSKPVRVADLTDVIYQTLGKPKSFTGTF